MLDRLLAVSALLVCVLPAAFAEEEGPMLYQGQSVVDVNVTLSGDQERNVVRAGDTEIPEYTYTAAGTYRVEGDPEDEAMGIPIVEQYTWTIGNAIKVSGGGPGDKSVTVRYNVDDQAENVITVVYSVTGGGSDSDSITVVVPYWFKNTDVADPDGEMVCPDGITSPGDGDGFLVGSDVPIHLGELVDWDARHSLDVTYHNDVDYLTVTWTATAGTFPNGNEGRDVTWRAPSLAQSGIIITAKVTDNATGPDHEDWIGRVESFDLTCSITLTAMDVTAVLVNRCGTTDAMGTGATIAAGKIADSTHQANVVIEVGPIPTGSYSLPIPVGVSGTAANGGNSSGDDAKPSVLSIGGASITGEGTATITMSTPSVSGTFLSSNRMGTCVVGARGTTATITQAWNRSAGADSRWDYEPDYHYEVYEPVSYTIELAEGEGIAQHDLTFLVTEASYLQLNFETWEWDDHPGVTENLDIYSEFANDASGSGDGTVQTDSSGKATVYQIVREAPDGDWTIFVYGVCFKLYDGTVWE